MYARPHVHGDITANCSGIIITSKFNLKSRDSVRSIDMGRYTWNSLQSSNIPVAYTPIYFLDYVILPYPLSESVAMWRTGKALFHLSSNLS